MGAASTARRREARNSVIDNVGQISSLVILPLIVFLPAYLLMCIRDKRLPAERRAALPPALEPEADAASLAPAADPAIGLSAPPS